jgi:hypothetical protein
VPAAALRYIEPTSIRFFRVPGGTHLRAEILDELCILEARVKRAFPFSATDNFLSIQDASGKEVGLISAVEQLDEESKRLVAEELDRRYFTPKITGVESLKNEGGMWTFVVQTQRGVAQFFVRNWRDSSHEIAPGRVQINSVDGQRFEIEKWSELDPKSQTMLEQLF